MKFLDRVKVSTPTVGQGNATVGDASIGFQSFSQAGVQDGDVFRYGIEDGIAWEIGLGTYSSGEVIRDVLDSSNGGDALDLSGNAVLFATISSDDMLFVSGDAGNQITEGTDGGLFVPAPQLASENW